MTLPVRRHRAGTTGELGIPAWTRDPLAEFEDLFNRMSRLFESAVGSAPMAEMAAWAPLADMTETDDAYLIEADLPGVARDDIDISMGGRELVIAGELKERERTGVLRRGTRRAGRFEYRALLPADVKADDVHAALNDGVLTVTVPKAEKSKPRHIEITSGD
ncbi:Hsp20 family protein [Streptomyces sp. SCUT-3]|nr:Hsp20/alpha crystallin family protein [Streptomyces sp. SCUT-3]PLW72742.1 heat-shock protein Hsp20 [Streptomyces sp. DJ]QMV22615.1 Hsp20 family protein [Streptomyces sp. SCUT-3]